MLEELLKELQTLKSEVETIKQLPENQREAAATTFAEKVLNTLDNAHVEIPEEYQSNSGEQI
jgi:hypothetical protein